jgi:hypothetical protein
MAKDGGYLGQIVSLGGIKGAPGQGLTTQTANVTTAAGIGFVCLAANPGRVWALITNEGAGDLTYSFEGGITAAHVLLPKGHILINRDLPWTGAVTVDGTSVVSTTEASIIV